MTYTADHFVIWPFVWGATGNIANPGLYLIKRQHGDVCRGIEEIGIYIEEPFSLLPLEALAAKLALMVDRMRSEHMSIDAYLEAKPGLPVMTL